MLSFNAHAFYRAVSGLRSGQAVTSGWDDDKKAKVIPPSGLALVTEAVKSLIDSLRVLGVRVAMMPAERLLGDLKAGGVTYAVYADSFAHIDRVLRDELSMSKVYALDPGMERYLDPAIPLMGPDVQSKFPSAAFDIEEAGKCLAFGRDTASVFHLMRVMEIAMKAVHACLALPPPTASRDRNWGNMLSAIRTENMRRQAFAEKDLFQELFALMDSVKDAWRNSTMHVERTYTKEEADRILSVVSGFMKRLASRMDEQGLPHA